MKQALILCLLLACGSIAYGQPYYLNSYRTGDPGTENWSSLGPSESEYGPGLSIDRGRINAIWVNHNDSNNNQKIKFKKHLEI
jgi:hypothetical protein